MSSRILWVSNFQSILWFLNTFCNKYIHGLHWAWGPARICCVRSPVCVETTNWIHVSIYSLTIEQIHISLLSLSSWKFGEPAILPSKRWGLIILTFLKESEWVGHFFSGLLWVHILLKVETQSESFWVRERMRYLRGKIS